MAKLTIESGNQQQPELAPGALMIHIEQPPLVVIVDEVTSGGEGFWGTSLDHGYRIEYDASQFVPFIGKLVLEQ